MSNQRHLVKAAVYLVLRNNDDVLLLKRKNTAFMDGYYGLVSGHIEPGESAIDATIREGREESGIELNADDLKLVYVSQRLSKDTSNDYIDLYFESQKWHGEISNAEAEKCEELRWVNIASLPDETIPYVKMVLETYSTGKNFSTLERQE